MGNLAVKCENQMQQTKKIANRVRGAVDVQVRKADGTGVEEFDRSVLVFEVMYLFPDYVVVQWCPRRNPKLGKWEQLRVLRRHEVLVHGQTYMLFPIPVEILKNSRKRRSRRMQSTKDRLLLLRERAETVTMSTDGSMRQQQETLQNEKPSEDGKSEMVLPSFPGFNVPEVPNVVEESEAILEKGTFGNQEEQTSQKPKFHLQPCFFNGSNWKPALLSIPESPIGLHRPETPSPQTPKTPIAFRLVSSREQTGDQSMEVNGAPSRHQGFRF